MFNTNPLRVHSLRGFLTKRGDGRIRTAIVMKVTKLGVSREYPPYSYSVNELVNELIIVKAFESGYYPLDQETPNKMCEDENITMDELADHLNAGLGVTKGQRQAMYMGSMFGWGIPAADPDRYYDDGTMKRDYELWEAQRIRKTNKDKPDEKDEINR